VADDLLTHYYRPCCRPFQRLSALGDAEVSAVIEGLSEAEPLPYRLTRPEYLPERRQIEDRMRSRFIEKGGEPELLYPHYFVLGEFALFENDGSLKRQLPLRSVPERWLSFTLTDSFFNYRRSNLRGIAIPPRPYHDELFVASELSSQLEANDLPTTAWQSDPERQFEVYVEAQLWSDVPLGRLEWP